VSWQPSSRPIEEVSAIAGAEIHHRHIRLMGLEVQGPLIEEGLPVLDAVQVRCSDGDHVLLVNRSVDDAVDCHVGRPVAEFQVMAGSGLRDEALRVKKGEAEGRRVTLPPLSVSRCRLAK